MIRPRKTPRPRPAIFSCPGLTYHADTCEPLRQAAQRGEVRLAALCRRGYPGTPLPAVMLPEVSSVGFWDALTNQRWGLGPHRNEGVEITYLARGKAHFQVGGQAYPLENGHLTVTRPWQEHRVGNPHVAASRLHWLILDLGVRRPDQTWRWPEWFLLSPADLRRLTTLLSHNEQPVWRANAACGECFETIAHLVTAHDPAAVQTRLRLHLNELFIVLLELLQEKSVVLDARLASTRRSVEMFLDSLPVHLDQPWTLAEMARHCGLGRSRFSEYCRQITNLTPAEYLIQCRVAVAQKRLVAQPEQSITDVAFASGFQSSQYFATVFRAKTGLTPREFRSQGGARS